MRRRPLAVLAAAIVALAAALAVRAAVDGSGGSAPVGAPAATTAGEVGGAPAAISQAGAVRAPVAGAGTVPASVVGVMRARVVARDGKVVRGTWEGRALPLPALAERAAAERYRGSFRVRAEPEGEQERELEEARERAEQEEAAGAPEPEERSAADEKLRLQALAPAGPEPAAAREPFARGAGVGGRSRPAVLASFEGLDVRDGQGFFPADPTLDVGPRNVVEMVNSAIAVYDRAGRRTAGPFTLAQFFSSNPATPCQSDSGDPIVLYDQLADRWIVTQFTFPTNAENELQPPNHLCVAVSDTGDALTATWRLHVFENPTGNFGDYPKWGVMQDGLFFGAIDFDRQFRTAPLVGAINRADLYAADPLTPVRFEYVDLRTTAEENRLLYLPADMEGRVPPRSRGGLFASITDDEQGGGNDAIRLLRLTPSWSPVASGATVGFRDLGSLPTGRFSGNLCNFAASCVAQASGPLLDPIADRAMSRASFRRVVLPGVDRESLVLTHTVDGLDDDYAAVRWYEVRNISTRPVLAQGGTYRPADAGRRQRRERWMGSVAINDRGAIALGFSRSGLRLYPSMAVAGRTTADRAGVLGAEVVLKAGSGPSVTPGDQSAADYINRWGDYSQMVVDPVDDCSFWYASMYARGATAGWSTRIARVRVGRCRTVKAPTLVRAPRVRGVARVGRTVRCGVGRWQAEPGIRVFAVTWLRGATVLGEGVTLRLRARELGRTIRCRVVATNLLGSATSTSATVRVRKAV